MKYTFNRNGVVEEVPLERWVWSVLYDDGTELPQFDENGTFHQIGEVDQARARRFFLFKPEDNKRIEIRVPDGARLIHGYKNFGVVSDEGTYTMKIYRFGYKHQGHTHLNYIMPDDTVVQATEELNAEELGLR